MSEELTFDEAYLSAAALSLQTASNSLREVECGTGFTFESVTGISGAAGRFFAELDRNLSRLASQVFKDTHTVMLLSEEAKSVDRQLAHVISAGFTLPVEAG